jgi:hypothetical protein
VEMWRFSLRDEGFLRGLFYRVEFNLFLV